MQYTLCNVCTNYILGEIHREYIRCSGCKIKCCKSCYEIGCEKLVFSKMQLYTAFYCSNKCVEDCWFRGYSHMDNVDYFFEFLFKTNWYLTTYKQEQVRSERDLIYPQIGKILQCVINIKDLCEIICEFY
jgi:hypothetical protein